MDNKPNADIGKWFWVALIVVLLISKGGGCKFQWPDVVPPAPSTPTHVTYVWEQSKGEITPDIRTALDTLNSKDIVATEFDMDTITKQGGTTPKQYEIAVAEAKKLGSTPLVVSRAGAVVLKVVAKPKAEDILALAP